jgi:hypothetical protein
MLHILKQPIAKLVDNISRLEPEQGLFPRYPTRNLRLSLSVLSFLAATVSWQPNLVYAQTFDKASNAALRSTCTNFAATGELDAICTSLVTTAPSRL